MVTKHVPVVVGDAEFLVEVSDAGSGVGTVSGGGVESFDGVSKTIEAIARQLASVWEAVKPDEATVEFGLKVSGKTGKLTGLLVEGGGEASLNVTLTWTATQQSAAVVPA